MTCDRAGCPLQDDSIAIFLLRAAKSLNNCGALRTAACLYTNRMDNNCISRISFLRRHKNCLHLCCKSLNMQAETASRARSNSRVVLTQYDAAEIYLHKLKLITPTCFKSCFQTNSIKIRRESAKLALKYGVTAKSIRDIWNHRSWQKATMHLWHDNPTGQGQFQVAEHDCVAKSSNVQ